MQDYSIERNNVPNLDFTGDLIGQSGGPVPTVKIYRTKALKYVGELRANQKYAQAQGDFEKPIDLINWFKSLNYGSLDQQVEDAIEDAAKNDAGFNAAWNIHVD